MTRNVFLWLALALLGFMIFKWLQMSPDEHQLVKDVVSKPPSVEQTLRLSKKREKEVKAEIARMEWGR